jgi:hypothetical protein
MQWSKVGHELVGSVRARNNIPTEMGTMFFRRFVCDPIIIVFVTMTSFAKQVLQKN